MEERLKDGDWLVRRWQDKQLLDKTLLCGVAFPTMAFILTLDSAPVDAKLMNSLRDNSVIESAISGN